MKGRKSKHLRLKCKVCGEDIKQYGSNAKGFCNKRKWDIMRRWNQVPFETRYELLLCLGGRDGRLH